MKKIGLVVNFKKEQAVEALKHIASLATGMGFEILADETTARHCPAFTVCAINRFAEDGAEAVVVLGGDGTMLEALHRMGERSLPMMGLNIGSLGFLTSVESVRFGDALKMLREDRFRLIPRSVCAVMVRRSDGRLEPLPHALNDVVINHGACAHAIQLEVSLNERIVADFLCDGIILATPTGSTAYSLSANGPILLPDVSALIVNVICPHTLTFRPLVVRDDTHIAIRILACDTPVVVSSDGRDDSLLKKGDVVEVRRAFSDVVLVELEGYHACDVLQRKLQWGHNLRP